MRALRTLCLALVCAAAVAACDKEPTFDASSLPAYRKSLSDINAKLSPADQRRLQIAIITLATGGGADYAVFGRPDPSRNAGFEMLEGVANPTVYLDFMRQRIDGKTAAAVISRAAGDLDVQISAAEARSGGAENALKAFIIENPRYFMDRSQGRDQPMVQFSIYNGGRFAISIVHLAAALTVPGVKAPLATGGLVYRFSQPLQPGAQSSASVYLASAGDAFIKQLDGIYDADLKLSVSNIDTADGKRLLATNADVLDAMRHKRDVLRGG